MIIGPVLCGLYASGGVFAAIDDYFENNIGADIWVHKFMSSGYRWMAKYSRDECDRDEYIAFADELDKIRFGLERYKSQTDREDFLEGIIGSCFSDDLIFYDYDVDCSDLKKNGLLYDLRDDKNRSYVTIGVRGQSDGLEECFADGFVDLEVFFSGRSYLPEVNKFALAYALHTGCGVDVKERLSTFNNKVYQ